MSAELPKGWQILMLRDVCKELQSGKRPKGGVQGIASGIPSIGAEHLDSNGGFKFSKIKFVPEEFAKQMKKGVLQKDDIVIVKDGATTGKASFVSTNFPFDFAVINEHVFILRLTENIFPRYAFYKIWSSAGNKEILKDFRGAAQGGISSGFIDKVTIPLPPKPTQIAIVSKIEELFREIENGIKSLFTAKEQLKKYRQSVLKWAFEGRLTNGLNGDLYDLPNGHDLSIAAEPETKYRVEGNHNKKTNQKNYSSNKGELPEGWKWVKIGDVCKCIVPNRDKPKSFTGNIKWITTPNLNENSIRLNYENVKLGLSEIETKEYNARIIPIGSVIMTCVGTFGLSAIVEKPIVINQQLHAFITNEKVNSKYLAYCIQFNKYYFESKSTSTTIQYLNKTNCNSMPFSLCSIEEQIYIVEQIESRLSVADKMEEIITESLQQAEALKQSILKKAFEGKLI